MTTAGFQINKTQTITTTILTAIGFGLVSAYSYKHKIKGIIILSIIGAGVGFLSDAIIQKQYHESKNK